MFDFNRYKEDREFYRYTPPNQIMRNEEGWGKPGGKVQTWKVSGIKIDVSQVLWVNFPKNMTFA